MTSTELPILTFVATGEPPPVATNPPVATVVVVEFLIGTVTSVNVYYVVA